MTRVQACGPDFPNNLLSGGDAAVLVAPQAAFARELVRLRLAPPRFPASESTNGFAAEAGAAELADLRAALKRSNLSVPESVELETNLQSMRASLETFVERFKASENSRPWIGEDDRGHDGEPTVPAPQFPTLSLPAKLPGEFSDYLEGALAWYNPALVDKGLARQAWQRLLARPPAERRFKSTWAAFMLGRAWEQDDPAAAVRYYEQVRELAQKGFNDSIGLAAASLGMEARVHLRRKHFEPAISLYLDQLAAGDGSSTNSLRMAAGAALGAGPAALRALARNPRTQRVITAYVISQPVRENTAVEETESEISCQKLRNWLAAVESAEVSDVESSEEFALAAYRANEMELASRWIKRAPGSPVAQWLQAKLLLRAGKVSSAASLLAKVAQYFPVMPLDTNEVAPAALKDTLYLVNRGSWPYRMPVERQVLGELGAVRLARRDYAQALDALLNAGFWMDAAYVAERVLSVDELKTYVDTHWPEVPPQQSADEERKFPNDEICPAKLRGQIRYLLARRLTRSFRSEEARTYYPPERLEAFDSLVRALNAGWDETQPGEQRAKALFEAAVMTRTTGMELIGTEVEPDWHIHGGAFEEGVTAGDRARHEDAQVLVAADEELQRTREHRADPEMRFHYRYHAAALAWEAAKFMPNNSDATAHVLWTAGTWLKVRDPRTADLFYKALVRRNRRTALGAEADRQRWFPQLDGDGNVILRAPKAEPPEPEGAGPNDIMVDQAVSDALPESLDTSDSGEPANGYEYVVRKGDSLASIVQRFSEAGVETTAPDILEANPGLVPWKLRVGEKLFIPIPKQPEETESQAPGSP